MIPFIKILNDIKENGSNSSNSLSACSNSSNGSNSLSACLFNFYYLYSH